jgi:uncharacterized protein YndB with AHSA1/START domain
MKYSLNTKTSITIDATAEQVWKALTTPFLIKKYLMGTNVTSDWKVGSDITYEGEYEGKAYREKGVIKKMEPNQLFQSTYLSSGKDDKPENYKLVTYKISNNEGKTKVTLTQDNNASEKEKDHSTANWKMVLKKMKEVLESEKTARSTAK